MTRNPNLPIVAVGDPIKDLYEDTGYRVEKFEKKLKEGKEAQTTH